MDDDRLYKVLTERFVEAIGELFQPCPLIGPRWFRFGDGARDGADFQFVGAAKLAKATIPNPPKVAARLLETVKLDDLPVEAEVTASHNINVRRTDRPAAGDGS